MKAFVFALITLTTAFAGTAKAQDSSEYYSGKVKAAIILSTINSDGYEKKISGGFFAKIFGDSIQFEVTPSNNAYYTLNRGTEGGKRTQNAANFKETVDYYTTTWNFSTTLTAAQVSAMIETGCEKFCQKRHPEVVAALANLAKSTDTFDISSDFYNFSGEFIGDEDDSDLAPSFNVPANGNNQLKVTLRFPKHWRSVK